MNKIKDYTCGQFSILKINGRCNSIATGDSSMEKDRYKCATCTSHALCLLLYIPKTHKTSICVALGDGILGKVSACHGKFFEPHDYILGSKFDTIDSIQSTNSVL